MSKTTGKKKQKNQPYAAFGTVVPTTQTAYGLGFSVCEDADCTCDKRVRILMMDEKRQVIALHDLTQAQARQLSDQLAAYCGRPAGATVQ